ncbi:uncharacterized protein LOC116773693 isoform X1 [Danaus plexippus]|uniref:Uncharacterized protein n=1 Tax=Danaus plexippus plexippus TaxID=278856 RepID=A0A212EXD5_DANPL|nr:uncharacterized protein LOC116773693 isoform X1 [Danaus plexippus]OWR46160.1 hypothetical protein KGM_206569 [Danaus plexippus plexippus]
MTRIVSIVSVLACIFTLLSHSFAAGPIGTFLQMNAIGFPVIHQLQKWVFDPDVALRRRRQFIDLHGDKGSKLIERLGLGVDGYADERLRMQRERDVGHLGGLNSLRP